MRNKLVFLGLVLSLGALLVCSQKAVAATSVAGHKIVIDAGHGGSDPGSTMCEGKTEAEANLEVAILLQGMLGADGAIVYMTREGDETLDNRDRYTFANDTDGEVLVSVHFNGSTDRTLNYTQGLYAKWKKDIDLASTIHSRLARELGINDKGLLQFASGVILKADMPATIQEVSFISHPDECAELLAGTRQEEIAQSLYNGLVDWFGGAQVPAHPGNKNK
jgi:N-acetylmuramoyl-L-alanine amidase